MIRIPVLRVALLLLWGLCPMAAVGCSGSGSSTADAGADGLDAAGDPGADPGGDPSGDPGGDAGADPGGDAGGDAGADPGGDAGADPGGDAGGDAGADPGGDAGGDPGGDPGCQPAEPFDYSCEPDRPETCPGGFCVLGMCIAPVLDPDRWAGCGDGSCGPCETAAACPADCGQWPQFSGEKEYANDTTITVWIHGFYNKSPEEMEQMTFGAFESCGGILGKLADYGIERPCGDGPPGDLAPDQLVEIEYYGGQAPAWMDPADAAAIQALPYEGTTALERYARIVALAIRHKLTVSGASHVNLACHSMGCLVTRHLIEHDLEGLATENRFVRWFSSAGVIAGARLARLYDNPDVRYWAPLLGLELSDFAVMHPDFVRDKTCVWDHALYQGNNPTLGAMIIHHATATDPHIAEAMDIALIDLNNPGDEPNDGIMYTLDEYFHHQDEAVVLEAPDGRRVQPSTNAVHIDHMNLPKTEAAAVLAAANLFHRRRVVVTLQTIELFDDREHHQPFDGEHGAPPAEVAAEVDVRYDPYLAATFGRQVLIHQTRIEHRSPAWFEAERDVPSQPGYRLYAGPVFDEMDELHLVFELLELDWYPRAEVREWAFDVHERLLEFDEQIPLDDGLVIERENERARIGLLVEVIDLY